MAPSRAKLDSHFFSVDEFLYSRCVVVANGEQVYDEILSNPTAMPKDSEFESVLYLAGTAYSQKTGRDFDYCAPTSYETSQTSWGGGRERAACD